MTRAEVLTLTLSIAAIAVSVLSLLYTLLWSARPFIRVELNAVAGNDHETTPSWRLSIANRGNGPAYDVRISIRPGDRRNEVEYVGSLDPDESFHGDFQITDYVEEEFGGSWANGPTDPQTQRALIQWRTLPVLRIPRRMKVRPGTGKGGVTLVERDTAHSTGAVTLTKTTRGAL